MHSHREAGRPSRKGAEYTTEAQSLGAAVGKSAFSTIGWEAINVSPLFGLFRSATCPPITRSRVSHPKAGMNTFVSRKILRNRSRGDIADLPALPDGIIQLKTSVIG